MILTNLSKQDRIDIFNEVGKQKRITSQAVEKDWWICIVLEALFTSRYKENIVFKGGTSLSKAWNLISRFSEDIDIAIDREFLGYGNDLTKNQISNRLRRSSCAFVRNQLKNEVDKGLQALGIQNEMFNLFVEETSISTVDPEKIYVEYASVFDDIPNNYIRPRVIIEAGARSISDPFTEVVIQSFLSETFPDRPFTTKAFPVRIVPAERTFLEKAFLLHEEFHKADSEIRTDRMSRHLYDLEKMMDTPIASNALHNMKLYNGIIAHRQKFIGLKGFDYTSLKPECIDFVPPKHISDYWKRDYQAMRDNIIYGPSVNYETLIKRIKVLNLQFKQAACNINAKE